MFCPKGVSGIKDFLRKITDDVEKYIEEITVVTGKIKELESDPTVEAIVALVPIGSTIEGYLNKGIDLIQNGANTALTFAEKLKAWLDSSTPLEKDMKAFKLASVSVAAADGQKQKQSTYDTAVQTHIEGLK